MKPSPQGRLPNAPGAVRSPSSAIPSRPVRSSRRSVPRGQVTCASPAAVEQLGDRAAARGHRREVARHQAREHVLGDARERRAARAGARSRPCARGCARASGAVGAMNTSAAASAAATAAGGSWPSTSRGSITQARLRRRARGGRRAARRRGASVVRSTTITTSSPGCTPRHGSDDGLAPPARRSLMAPGPIASGDGPHDPFALGDPVPAVRAPRHRGRRAQRRRSTTRPPATVLVVTCMHCPYVIAWNPRLRAVAEEYAPRGVRFLGIHANDAEPLSGRLARPHAPLRARAGLAVPVPARRVARTSRARSAPR